MLFTKGRPKAWEAPEDRQGCRASLLIPGLGIYFSLAATSKGTNVFLLLVSSLPASQLIPLDWVPFVLGCFPLNIFSCFTLPAFCSCALPSRGVHLSVMLSQHQLWRQHWLTSSLPSPPAISVLPISVMFHWSPILSTFYRSSIVLNSFHILWCKSYTASLWNRHCFVPT